jgi:hypothetical protein
MLRTGIELLLFLFHETELRLGFSSPEWFILKFQVFASTFVLAERNSSCFLFRGMVQNGILRICFYFCSTVQNSEHFSPLRNGSERNSESFLSCEIARILPELNRCSVRIPRNNFFVEIANTIHVMAGFGTIFMVTGVFLNICYSHRRLSVSKNKLPEEGY